MNRNHRVFLKRLYFALCWLLHVSLSRSSPPPLSLSHRCVLGFQIYIDEFRNVAAKIRIHSLRILRAGNGHRFYSVYYSAIQFAMTFRARVPRIVSIASRVDTSIALTMHNGADLLCALMREHQTREREDSRLRFKFRKFRSRRMKQRTKKKEEHEHRHARAFSIERLANDRSCR